MTLNTNLIPEQSRIFHFLGGSQLWRVASRKANTGVARYILKKPMSISRQKIYIPVEPNREPRFRLFVRSKVLSVVHRQINALR